MRVRRKGSRTPQVGVVLPNPSVVGRGLGTEVRFPLRVGPKPRGKRTGYPGRPPGGGWRKRLREWVLRPVGVGVHWLFVLRVEGTGSGRTGPGGPRAEVRPSKCGCVSPARAPASRAPSGRPARPSLEIRGEFGTLKWGFEVRPRPSGAPAGKRGVRRGAAPGSEGSRSPAVAPEVRAGDVLAWGRGMGEEWSGPPRHPRVVALRVVVLVASAVLRIRSGQDVGGWRRRRRAPAIFFAASAPGPRACVPQ